MDSWLVYKNVSRDGSKLIFSQGNCGLLDGKQTKKEAVISFIEYSNSINYDIISRLTKKSAGEIYPYLIELKENKPHLFL